MVEEDRRDIQRGCLRNLGLAEGQELPCVIDEIAKALLRHAVASCKVSETVSGESVETRHVHQGIDRELRFVREEHVGDRFNYLTRRRRFDASSVADVLEERRPRAGFLQFVDERLDAIAGWIAG